MTLRICASIVVYQPDFSNLAALLTSLSQQVADIIILNNNETDNLQLKNFLAAFNNTILINVHSNAGINAHNISVAWASENQFDYIVLFDQDSCPQNNMISQLIKADLQLRQQGKLIVAVGPRAVDSRSGESMPFMRFVGFNKKKCYCDDAINYCQADSLIMSGMLIKLAVFKQIGLFDTSLFMDNVDMEWCLRARAKGWYCFGVCDAVLQHRLGDKIIKFLGKSVNIHSPWRQYYIFYNRIALYKRNYIPLIWKLNDAIHILFKIILHGLATPPRKQYLSQIFRGLWNGFRHGKSQPEATPISYEVVK